MKIYNNYISGFVDGCNFNVFTIKKKNFFLINVSFFFKLNLNKNLLNKKKILKLSLNKKNVNIYEFKISLCKKNLFFLYALKTKFKCGNITLKKINKKINYQLFTYCINDKQKIQKNIIVFFCKFPLQSINKIYFYKYIKHLYKNNELLNIYTLNLSLFNLNFFNITNEWFTGFVDCLGEFNVEIEPCFLLNNFNFKNIDKLNNNFKVTSKITFIVNKLNKNLIYHIQKFVNCGCISFINKNTYIFCVQNNKHLILNIFPKLYTNTSKNLLKTIKRVKFQKFRKIVLMYLSLNKNNLNIKNIKKIIKLKQYIDNN